MAPEKGTVTKRNRNIVPLIRNCRHLSKVFNCSFAFIILSETLKPAAAAAAIYATMTHFYTPGPGNRFSFQCEPMHQTITSQKGTRWLRPRRLLCILILHFYVSLYLSRTELPLYTCLCLAEVGFCATLHSLLS